MLPENVLFSNSPYDDLKSFLKTNEYSQVVVLTDENTTQYCLHYLGDLPDQVIEVQSGEENKTLKTCEYIWQKMTDLTLDRHALVLILGGGVLGDMGGFCAATYKRGIDFILIPTTLLSQVDASIGGKLGIDFKTFKNHIGVFQQPTLTLLYSGFLSTLPIPELRSGFAEVIKHCLISDKQMWKQITNGSLEEQPWDLLLRHSVEFKAKVTSEDPKEKGLRKILNAGHTIGHAVESYLLGKGRRILHGEAIAIGLITECFIAKKRGLLTAEEFEEIKDFVLSVFGKVSLSQEDLNEASLLTVQDKKNKGNKIMCVLPEGIGKARWDEEIMLSEIIEALTYYQGLQM
jgi:3-dehydroquinate synthase